MTKVLLAVTVGMLIAWVDSRPNWDDTGVTAFALFAVSGLFAALSPKRPWVWALAIGIWIPLVGIVWHQNYGSLSAIVFAVAGAYAAALIRRSIRSAPQAA